MPDFGLRLRPEEITLDVRRRLAWKIYRREFFALAAVFFPSLLLTLVVLALYRSFGEPPGSEWEPMSPILVTVAVILIVIHIWSLRERRFVEKAHPAAAEVKDIETSYDLTHSHRLILKYRPMQDRPKGPVFTGLNSSTLVVVDLESDLPGFSTELHCGDAVSILYDPAQPDHVCIVEEEHMSAA